MLQYYLAPSILYRLAILKRNVRMDPTKLEKLQQKKLRIMIKYAYDNVPFYHKLFDTNQIRPEDINTPSDLKKIPIVTRKTIQENTDSVFSTKIDITKCAKKKTSGSSGIPLIVTEDKRTSTNKALVSLRQFLECGGRFRDKQIQLREPGASSLPENSKKSFYESLGFLRTEWIKTGDIFDELIPFLKSYRPDVLIGYPGFLQLLAEKSNGAVHSRIIFTTGEILSNHCRQLLNSTFEAKVIDSYGCAETGDIAWECPEEHQGYHMNTDSVLVEFIRDGENVAAGEDGEVVLTSLFNTAMPFIRYKVGDIGVPSDEQCSCGRTLPLMRLLKGRSDDFIILPSGKKLSPLGMVNIQDFVGIGVSEMMIIQKNQKLIEVLLKMQLEHDEDRVKKCVAQLQEIVGTDVEVKPRFVAEIPRNRSGKFRRVISRVSDPNVH
jgi:phenylacetate-CoA ligase